MSRNARSSAGPVCSMKPASYLIRLGSTVSPTSGTPHSSSRYRFHPTLALAAIRATSVAAGV